MRIRDFDATVSARLMSDEDVSRRGCQRRCREPRRKNMCGHAGTTPALGPEQARRVLESKSNEVTSIPRRLPLPTVD
jgi:hypothetical protein